MYIIYSHLLFSLVKIDILLLEYYISNTYPPSGMEVLEQIKETFQKFASNSEKVLLLTLAPKSWGRRRLAKEFGASERQTRKAKKLVAENGILTSSNLKKVKL